MKQKHRRVVLTVVADLPSDISARLFRRGVERRLTADPTLQFPIAVENWNGSNQPNVSAARGRRELQRLLVRYIALQAKLGEMTDNKPTFDDQTGKRLIALALAEWDQGREHALLWLAAHLELLQRTIEDRVADGEEAEAWFKHVQQWAAAMDEKNTLIAEYELMTATLLDREIVRH